MAVSPSVSEDRIVRRNVSWPAYQAVLRRHDSRSAPHHYYDQGTLETVKPLAIHDRYAHLLDILITVCADELGIEAYGLRSTTFAREDLQQGFEADSCFYFANAARVQGKERLDLRLDPPPDLVIEIEVTRSALDKLKLYARFGVPEVWRFDGTRLDVQALEGDAYVSIPRSRWLAAIPIADVARLLDEGKWLSDGRWMRLLRAWVRSFAPPRGRGPWARRLKSRANRREARLRGLGFSPRRRTVPDVGPRLQSPGLPTAARSA